MKNELLEPCCKRFRKLAMMYADFSADLDQPMRGLTALLLSVKYPDMIDERTVMEIGHTLEEYLNRKVVYESYIFGRSLHSCTSSDADVAAELCRITLKVKESGWYGKKKDKS